MRPGQKTIRPGLTASGLTVATRSTDAASAEKKVITKTESGLNGYRPHLHVCLQTSESKSTCEQASLPVCCSWRHTLSPLFRLLQTRPPSPLLHYLVTTATTKMQAGRRLTHLDYPAPARPPTHPLALVVPRPPRFASLLCGISIIAPQLTSSLFSPQHSSYHVLMFLRQTVDVPCCFNVLFGGAGKMF